MTEAKTLLVVGEPSEATSDVVVEKLQTALPTYGIELEEIRRHAPGELTAIAHRASVDLVVTLHTVEESLFDVPVVPAAAFLTGIGEQETLETIASHLAPV